MSEEIHEIDPFVINEDDLAPTEYEELTEEASMFTDIDSSDPRSSYDKDQDDDIDFDLENKENQEPANNKPDIDLEGDDDDDSINFEEDDLDGESDSLDDLTEEKLIEKLKALNYDVSKKDVKDPLEEEQELIKINKGFIQNAVNFINQGDEEVVRGKLRHDLINKFTKEGKSTTGHDFEDELEYNMEGYLRDKQVMKTFADVVRNQVQSNALEKKREIDDTNNAIQKREQQRLKNTRKTIQQAFNDIRKSDFYGVDISTEEYRQAYKNLTTGEVSKQIEDNPKLAAEVSLYLMKKDELSSRLGGPTYGEGVRDAVRNILGDDVSKPSTQRVMKNGTGSSKKDGLSSRMDFWKQKPKLDEEAEKTRSIIGYPGSF